MSDTPPDSPRPCPIEERIEEIAQAATGTAGTDATQAARDDLLSQADAHTATLVALANKQLEVLATIAANLEIVSPKVDDAIRTESRHRRWGMLAQAVVIVALVLVAARGQVDRDTAARHAATQAAAETHEVRCEIRSTVVLVLGVAKASPAQTAAVLGPLDRTLGTSPNCK